MPKPSKHEEDEQYWNGLNGALNDTLVEELGVQPRTPFGRLSYEIVNRRLARTRTPQDKLKANQAAIETIEATLEDVKDEMVAK